MNERGVEALVKAALDGVRQQRGMISGPDGELCAFGVLWAALGRPRTEGFHAAIVAEFGLRAGPVACGQCGEVVSNEKELIFHLNDRHEADFLTIARKLGPDAA